MLTVKTPDEALQLMLDCFPPRPKEERVPLETALGRVLFCDMRGEEYVPGFDRSIVDGYAVRASDTFGCSDALPAMLQADGAVDMGRPAPRPLSSGHCAAIPTGGALPGGADAAVMVEYTEDYGDGSVGIVKPVAPGQNLIRRGEDLRPGQVFLRAGRRLAAQDIGALAALGVTEVAVCRPPLAAILSTGDELVPVTQAPAEGQVRDVNSALLRAVAQEAGADTRSLGIIPDKEALLGQAIDAAVAASDLVVLSGGSSVGQKDAARRVIESRGEILFHGVAMKPGKPTMLGAVAGKPVLGLPGHPAAAFFAARLFLRPLLLRLMGAEERPAALTATLTEAIGANHGRAQYTGVTLSGKDGAWRAHPIHGQSGLIVPLAGAHGYVCVPRDREGFSAGETVTVTLC